MSFNASEHFGYTTQKPWLIVVMGTLTSRPQNPGMNGEDVINTSASSDTQQWDAMRPIVGGRDAAFSGQTDFHVT
jgi:hypothetical protein